MVTTRSAAKPTSQRSSAAMATPRTRARSIVRKRQGGKARAASAKEAKREGDRHVPQNCCGRRKQYCKCFKAGRGFAIANSLRRKVFEPITDMVLKSRIFTWRDTSDMPAYQRQIGWRPPMRYSWLFPIAFVWRHFSNEEFWGALAKVVAVLEYQPPRWDVMEEVMRAFYAKGVSYHGGVFYSGAQLVRYRFGSAATSAEWEECDDTQDFIAREVLASEVAWHVATNLKGAYDSLQERRSRHCWKACAEEFLRALHEHTTGIFPITL